MTSKTEVLLYNWEAVPGASTDIVERFLKKAAKKRAEVLNKYKKLGTRLAGSNEVALPEVREWSAQRYGSRCELTAATGELLIFEDTPTTTKGRGSKKGGVLWT